MDTAQFDPIDLDWTSTLLAGWTYVEPVKRWFQGQYRNGHSITRTCPTCSETINLVVTAKALRGEAKNHGLALRRCKECRKALHRGKDAYAIHKAKVSENKPDSVGPENELDEAIMMANRTMKEELDGCYTTIKDLRDRLAKYELPLAIAKSVLPNRLPWE